MNDQYSKRGYASMRFSKCDCHFTSTCMNLNCIKTKTKIFGNMMPVINDFEIVKLPTSPKL